jgi:L-lactate dehydrogenase complex protein LldG
MTKDDFLNRIRSALHRHEGSPMEAPPALLEPQPQWDSNGLVDQFKLEHETLTGKYHLVHSIEGARLAVQTIISELEAKSFIRSTDILIDEIVANIQIPLAQNPADADVGITGVRCAIAQTGTLVLTSDVGRIASLLPMNHIAIVKAEQLVPTMLEAFETYMDIPTAWIQATGPSRTADIEQTLEIGVHGPGVVHVIMIQ